MPDCNTTLFSISLSLSILVPHLGQERTDKWSSAVGPDEIIASEMTDNVWRPIIGPGEVTVTDITLNSLTVTFKESRVAKGFFRGWGLEV